MNRTDLNEPTDTLIVAVTPRALFDLGEDEQLLAPEGQQANLCDQREREGKPFAPGSAFYLVKKLLALNEAARQRVEVALLSPHSADTSLQMFDTLAHHGLAISRAAFSSGAPYTVTRPPSALTCFYRPMRRRSGLLSIAVSPPRP